MAGPVDTALARKQCRIDGGDEDELLAGYILAAQDFVEDFTGLVIEADEERVETFDAFTSCIELLAWPVREIVSIAYLAADGSEQEIDAAGWRLVPGRPARLRPAVGTRWPATAAGEPGCVRVTFKAGFAQPEEVPPQIKVAILLLVEHFYRHRGAVLIDGSASELPIGVADLLRGFRLVRV